MRSGRVDNNQKEIVKKLRDFGATVGILSDLGRGMPDIVVGYRGMNYLFELKDGTKPPSQRRLTEAEADWHLLWRGQVAIANDLDTILKIIDVS